MELGTPLKRLASKLKGVFHVEVTFMSSEQSF